MERKEKVLERERETLQLCGLARRAGVVGYKDEVRNERTKHARGSSSRKRSGQNKTPTFGRARKEFKLQTLTNTNGDVNSCNIFVLV